ncbi:hypothetical protein D3C80_489290 [compost metagenome]
MTINLVIAIILLVIALITFNSGNHAAQVQLVETLGKVFLTMFAIEPFAVAFYLYWPKGE